jgi:L-threonylcarbamoyladenylate synthase
MNINISTKLDEAIDVIKNGGIVITKTDTIYGILANALDKEAVEKIYVIKGREKNKPFIILIPNAKFLKKFKVKENPQAEKILNLKGITVIFDVNDPNNELEYLHRGAKTLAFRIPDDLEFLNFLGKLDTPIVAPSANPSGLTPAEDIHKAIEYFKDKVDLYIDRGKSETNIPSTIVKVENSKIKILRQGSKQIDLS